MTKTTFTVQAQRSNGAGYVPCDIHQATSFAVVKVETFTRKGKSYTASRTISRHRTKNEAQGVADLQAKRFAPLPRAYKLGKRLIKEGF